MPVATDAMQFTNRRITAPIYATGWDGDVIVTMFADGRMDVRRALSR